MHICTLQIRALILVTIKLYKKKYKGTRSFSCGFWGSSTGGSNSRTCPNHICPEVSSSRPSLWPGVLEEVEGVRTAKESSPGKPFGMPISRSRSADSLASGHPCPTCLTFQLPVSQTSHLMSVHQVPRPVPKGQVVGEKPP